jgi:hypothetical protein
MQTATNIPMSVRLALVEPARTSALLFESARSGGRRSRDMFSAAMAEAAARGGSVTLPLNPLDNVAVRELPLGNTLLASAVGTAPGRRGMCVGGGGGWVGGRGGGGAGGGGRGGGEDGAQGPPSGRFQDSGPAAAQSPPPGIERHAACPAARPPL